MVGYVLNIRVLVALCILGFNNFHVCVFSIDFRYSPVSKSAVKYPDFVVGSLVLIRTFKMTFYLNGSFLANTSVF